MAEIHIDGDSIITYDEERVIREMNAGNMNISDFSVIDIGRALALYSSLCNLSDMDEDEVTIKFV